MLKIGICDDEQEILVILESYVKQYAEIMSVEIITETFSTGNELCKSMNSCESFDLIFLDIEMDNGNGVDAGKFIREGLQNEFTQIIYVSGTRGYDRQLFEVRPMCFIEKPVKFSDIKDAIDKYLRLYGNNSNLISFVSNHDRYWLDTNKIIYFESIGRKVKVVCDDKMVYEYYESMDDVFNKVKSNGFMMIHKAFIVNYRYVHKFSANDVVMSNGEVLPISKHRKKEVAKWQLFIENGGG